MGIRLAFACALFATLPGGLRGCNASRCPGEEIMVGMLEDRDMCGSRGTAVECRYMCPSDVESNLREREILHFEAASPGGASTEGASYEGSWSFTTFPRSQLGFGLSPRLFGVPRAVPLAAIRSSSERLVPNRTRMSAYLHTSDIRKGCILDIAVVWSWTLRPRTAAVFADDLEIAAKIVGRRGSCPEGSAAAGHAWKIEGAAWRSYEPGCISCHDCCSHPCIRDGWCEEFCPDDPDCDCSIDAFCNPDCIGTDPDCICGPDYRCNPLCDADVDCACIWDGSCNIMCVHDPDCECVPDGSCIEHCGWHDPDCLCIGDGICDPCRGCADDPDCPVETPH